MASSDTLRADAAAFVGRTPVGSAESREGIKGLRGSASVAGLGLRGSSGE